MNEIFYSKESRELVRKGVDAVADTVKVTLGPQGANVTIQTGNASHKVTKDGVTVANSILFDEEPAKNVGAQMIKEAARKTVEEAGDGTTTATILAQEIFSQSFDLESSKHNRTEVVRGIKEAVKDVVEFIEGNAEPISFDNPKVRDIAKVSSNNDPVIADLVAEAIAKTGKEGVVTIEEAKKPESYVEIVEGMSITSGAINPYFIEDPRKRESVVENPMILLINEEVTVFSHLLKALLHSIDKNKRPIVIIAEDVKGDAISSLIRNRMQGSPLFVIKAPGYGNEKTEILRDIEAVTGSVVVGGGSGLSLKDFAALNEEDVKDVLGQAEKVIIKEGSAIIVGGSNANQKNIDDRVAGIRKDLKSPDNPKHKEQLESRLARLNGGVGKICVGAKSVTEQKEIMDRVDDALRAAKSSIEEGIVPGAGYIYCKAYSHIKERGGIDSRSVGYDLLLRALLKPLKQIVDNGGDSGEVVVDKVVNGFTEDHIFGYGYNARTKKYTNLMEEGIIDPAKVCRVALENAASVAGNLITQEALITNKISK